MVICLTFYHSVCIIQVFHEYAYYIYETEINVVCYFVFYEQTLRPRGLELQQGELGDLVEQEMAATSAAVESAAARIEVIRRLPALPVLQTDA